MTIHYFPPNPEKIGDNLLTAEVALDVACAGWQGTRGVVVYYATAVVVGVLEGFELRGIRLVEVADLRESATRAQALRANGEAVVDLQQLNCWVDYPELRPLFDTDLPERSRLDWFDPAAIQRWGLGPFPDLFRQMLGIVATSATLAPKHAASGASTAFGRCGVLLFPHCATDSQQLRGWGHVAGAILSSPGASIGGSLPLVTVVGAEPARQHAWPPSVRLAIGLNGRRLRETIAGAAACIGGATGLTHLAGALRRPALGLWRLDDLEVFGPLPGWSVTPHVVAEIDQVVTERCARFSADAMERATGGAST